LKVAFINLGRHYGGVEVYVLSLIKAWMARGNECVVLARDESAFYHKLMKTGFADKVIPVDFDLKSIKDTRKRLLDEKVDLLHVNGINSGVFASLLRLSAKCVTTVHGSVYHERADRNILVQKLFAYLEKRCLNKSTKIISVSSAIKQILTERGINENKIELIYNGIEEIDNEQKEKADSELVKICMVGRLEEVKGCDYLICALAKLKDKKVLCDIYGEGTLKEELENLAQDLGVAGMVCFKGFSENIREVMSGYDILVQPSRFEAFPLTPLEAMNARVLLICSDIGGMREIVDSEENGLKFEVGNIEELSRKIIWAIEHKEEVDKMKKNAYDKFQREYTESVMHKRTFGLFERVYHEI